jgi:hypothetical protein
MHIPIRIANSRVPTIIGFLGAPDELNSQLMEPTTLFHEVTREGNDDSREARLEGDPRRLHVRRLAQMKDASPPKCADGHPMASVVD